MVWFLTLTLTRLTGKFGRVTAMVAIASLATRIMHLGAPHSWFVGLGYVLGGLTFDSLYFFPITKNLKGRVEKTYLLGISVLSGTVALIPYILFKFSVLDFRGFLVWISLYVYTAIKNVALNVLGTSIGIATLPQIEVWTSKIGEKPSTDLRLAKESKKISTGNFEYWSICNSCLRGIPISQFVNKR